MPSLPRAIWILIWVVIAILIIILLSLLVHWAGGGILNVRIRHFVFRIGFT